MALGKLPSEAELGALIERYAGSRRVSCEQADEFFASIGEEAAAKPARKHGAPQDVAEVARGSWLDKLGPRSSVPPRVAASVQQPALSIAAAASVHPEEPITIEQALEHLPATTYSSAPPPSALPSDDSAPVALPLSSRPAPQLTAKDSVVVERWGMAETTPEPSISVVEQRWGAAETTPEPAAVGFDVAERWSAAETTPEPVVEVNALSEKKADEAEEDALLNQWSDDLERAIAASERPEPMAAGAIEPEHAASTDAPERWSAPHLGGELPDAAPVAHDDDAPLSAAELSLLDQWSAEDPAQPVAKPAEDAAMPADTRRSSRAPRKRSVPPPLRPASLRPAAFSQPAAAYAARTDDEDDAPLDVELEEEIELEPDDLIEIDSE